MQFYAALAEVPLAHSNSTTRRHAKVADEVPVTAATVRYRLVVTYRATILLRPAAPELLDRFIRSAAKG